MIKTRHEIEISIDDEVFKVSVSEITKTIKAKLDGSLKKRGAKFEDSDNKRFQLAELENEYEINKAIIAEGSVLDKTKVWFEQKELNKKIFALKKGLNELNTLTNSLNEEVEEYYKEAFELCVGGENAHSLKQKIDELGLSYALVYQNIKQAVAKALEKK